MLFTLYSNTYFSLTMGSCYTGKYLILHFEHYTTQHMHNGCI